MKSSKLIISFLSLFVLGCSSNNKKKPISDILFTVVPNSKTNINFKNSVIETKKFNGLNYSYTYNGGGVAIGDINNDGFEDVYFTSNQKSNKLYLNKGSFKFEDITDKAKVQDEKGWTTGATMIDINNDGWLDIYVCKSAYVDNEILRKNKLFVNQKNGTFNEEAKKWGLDNNGFSIQSYFFDYDKDGDLDMFLVNHRNDFPNANHLETINKRQYFYETSDHLYRNDGNKFTNITQPSGLMNKEYSLSASIGDFNNDGWPDIYVANDFITPDYLYINNKNGTFSNQINKRLNHTSYSSMGSDFADINNDLLPDLLVVDMSAEDHRRGKQNMPSMNTNGFWEMVDAGYHYTYMSNILNLNNGNGTFSDIAQISGLSKTDWSWAPLIVDLDNDGNKDIFVTNGIKRELGNQDYRRILESKQDSLGNKLTIDEILSTMPSEKLANYAFKNNGDLSFKKVGKDWGFSKKVNSNGVAYADLDNDGDLDLILNNLEDKAIIYKNNSINNFINIKLIGDSKNINAVGARVKVYTDNKEQYQELYPSRGYQSSVSNVLTFGLGEEEIIKRIEVIWGDNSVLAADNVEANQTLTFNKKDFKFDGEIKKKAPKHFVPINQKKLGIDFVHTENKFNDFSIQTLMPQKQSQQGPTLSVADVNNDGLDDFFIGGALNQPASLYIQNESGKFAKSNENLLENEKKHEDFGSLFFDADKDGDLDLYVTSGGYELGIDNTLLQDRLYINDGKGNFSKKKLPKMLSVTKSVEAYDYDNDGDNDLFIGGRVIPGQYPIAPSSYVLENNNGNFTDVTQKVLPEFHEIGLVNDLNFSDYDGDGDKDLFVVGEWMPIILFENNNGIFQLKEIESFKKTEGWYNTIKPIDLDKDGDLDYLVGNLGDNNKFHPSVEKPLHIFGNYFDENGTYDMFLSKDYKGKLVPLRGKECSTEQNAFVSEKIGTYQEFANSTIADIYGKDVLEHSYHKQAYNFSSLYLINNGNDSFEVKKLPTSAQVGPTMAFEITDINKDGNLDVIGVGAIHEAEVETIRYDSNTGYILVGDAQGNLKPYSDISFYNNMNAKAMSKITISGSTCYLIANNDGPLTIFREK